MNAYLGPLSPYLKLVAEKVSHAIMRFGWKPPEEDVLILALVATLLCILVSLSFFGYSSLWGQRDKRDAVLIVGISGDGDLPAVGKTTLLKVLRNGELPVHGTVSSMHVNEQVFAPHVVRDSASPVRWIDYPGHPRLRHGMVSYIPAARCVVFLVDASRFTSQAREDAALLYEVLTHPAIAKFSTPVLIFCNKCDLPNVAKPALIQSRLQEELERIRKAKSASLRSVGSLNNAADAEDDDSVLLGFENESFVFDHAPGPVSFAPGSALNKDIMAVVNFVRSSFL